MPDRRTVLKLGQNESIIQLYLGGKLQIIKVTKS